MDLDAVRTELYELPPDQFTATREAMVRQARGEGDRALATEIGRLRKPTVSAWLVNLLARRRRAPLDKLLALGADLRAAQAALAGDDLRRLTAERQRRVSALVEDARRLAAEHGTSPSGSVEDEVTATLEAAVADPDAATAIHSGQLVTALQHSGFGWGDLPTGAASPRSVAAPAAAPAARRPARDGAADAVARAALRKAEKARDEALAESQRAQAKADAAVDRQAAAKALVVDLEGQLDRARLDATAAGAEAKAAGRAARVASRRADAAQSAVDRLG